jgi:hypothetical protein
LFITSEIIRITLYQNWEDRTEKYIAIGCLKNEFIFHYKKFTSRYFGKFDKELETIGTIAMKQMIEEKLNFFIYIIKII